MSGAEVLASVLKVSQLPHVQQILCSSDMLAQLDSHHLLRLVKAFLQVTQLSGTWQVRGHSQLLLPCHCDFLHRHRLFPTLWQELSESILKTMLINISWQAWPSILRLGLGRASQHCSQLTDRQLPVCRQVDHGGSATAGLAASVHSKQLSFSDSLCLVDRPTRCVPAADAGLGASVPTTTL